MSSKKLVVMDVTNEPGQIESEAFTAPSPFYMFDVSGQSRENSISSLPEPVMIPETDKTIRPTWTKTSNSSTIKFAPSEREYFNLQASIGASVRNMPPKTPNDKPAKKKPSTAKEPTPASKTTTKAGSKTVTSATPKRPTTPQAKHNSPKIPYPDSSMALSEELRERIAKRAYDIHHQRGGQHGSDWEDWLQAEREILLQQPPRS